MTGFLTIEDANTANLNIINEFYCLDTSLLGSDEYVNKRYDFVKVTRTNNQDESVTFSFEVDNSLWTGGFYVTDSGESYIDISENYNYDSSTNLLEITTSESDILIHFYLSSFYNASANNFKVEQLTWIQKHLDDFIDDFTLDLEGLKNNNVDGCYVIGYKFDYNHMNWIHTDFGYMENGGIILIDSAEIYELHDGNNNNHIFVKYSYVKAGINLSFDLNSVFTGVLNKIKLNISSSKFVGFIEGYVLFENSIIPIYMDGREFYFDLDLREYSYNHVNLKIVWNETIYNTSGECSFSFNIDYKPISTESELIDLIDNGGNGNIASDILLTNDIILTHNTKIIGDGNCIDLNGHSIILSEGVNFNMENVVLDKGDNAIIQGRNTKLDLNNVSFRNCISSKYNNQGACILCDIDINSLDTLDDYITNLKDCSFIDNHNCIVHGGLLTVTNCTYENTDITYSDKHNVGFLYQVDGEATITDSRFDINYLSDQYCLNEESIGYAQAILKIGGTASINNYEHEDFINNRFKFNNECHVFCKYYYEKIEACVYTSPVNGKESESYCYSASGTNWVFKENVQVTRASSNRENTYNPLME